MAATEAMTNAIAGLFVSWGVTYYVLPLWGLTPTMSQAMDITALYFVVSFLRSWIIRVSFRKWLS